MLRGGPGSAHSGHARTEVSLRLHWSVRVACFEIARWLSQQECPGTNPGVQLRRQTRRKQEDKLGRSSGISRFLLSKSTQDRAEILPRHPIIPSASYENSVRLRILKIWNSRCWVQKRRAVAAVTFQRDGGHRSSEFWALIFSTAYRLTCTDHVSQSLQ